MDCHQALSKYFINTLDKGFEVTFIKFVDEGKLAGLIDTLYEKEKIYKLQDGLK